jgi:hypothetical protein
LKVPRLRLLVLLISDINSKIRMSTGEMTGKKKPNAMYLEKNFVYHKCHID